MVGSLLLVRLGGGFPVDPFLSEDGLFARFDDGVAVEPNRVESFSGACDLSAVALASAAAVLADELDDAALGVGHDAVAHFFAAEENSFKEVAIAVGDLDLAVQTSLFPTALVGGAVEELVDASAVLATIAEFAEKGVLIAVPHGAESVALVVHPLSFETIAIGPVEGTKAMTEGILVEERRFRDVKSFPARSLQLRFLARMQVYPLALRQNLPQNVRVSNKEPPGLAHSTHRRRQLTRRHKGENVQYHLVVLARNTSLLVQGTANIQLQLGLCIRR